MKKYLATLCAGSLLLACLVACGKSTPVTTTPTTTPSSSSSTHFVQRDLEEVNLWTPATAFAGGDGTAEMPFEIADASQLALLADKLSNTEDMDYEEEQRYAKGYYVLTADIALNDTADFSTWEDTPPQYQWVPIATSAGDSLHFDGQGHTISGLYLNANAEDYQKNTFGLFANNHGVIENVHLTDAFFAVSGVQSDVGGLAGMNWETGTIANVSNNGTMLCYQGNVGGIAGRNYGTVSNSAFTGSIVDAQENTDSFLAGICANNDGEIQNCTNQGTLWGASGDGDSVGGIVSYMGEGTLLGCINQGDVTGSDNTGGIVATIFVSNIGGEHDCSTGVTVNDCHNSGVVTASTEQGTAGGIAGEATTSHSIYHVELVDCTNTGDVYGEKNTGGILGEASIGSDQDGYFKVAGCINQADLTGTSVGGIVASACPTEGSFLLENCGNQGNITATELYAGGIVANITSLYDQTKEITLRNCTNEGTITAPTAVGGMVGIMANPTNAKETKDCAVVLTHNENTGNLASATSTGIIGGMVGIYGMAHIDAEIAHNTASGTIVFDQIQMDLEGIAPETDSTFALTRIAGGMIGRLGYGLFLSTDQDAKDFAANLNSADAPIVITDCHSQMAVSAVGLDDIVTDEFGGILGNYSGDDEFEVRVEQCTYENMDTMLGTVVEPA